MKPAWRLAMLSLACAQALAQAPDRNRQERPAPAAGGMLQLDDNITPEFRSWLAANPWYGRDAQRTEFARASARQLLQENPALSGRPLLDAVSRRVAGKFGPPR